MSEGHEPELVAELVSSRHAMTRLATHLADVKDSDMLHRQVRTELEQKLEALIRLVVEEHDLVTLLQERMADAGLLDAQDEDSVY